MSELADIRIGEEVTADDSFPHKAVFTTDSILSDADAVELRGTAFTPSFTLLPSAPEIRTGVTSADSEERSLCPIVAQRTLLRQKREDADDLMSLLKTKIIQDGIRREEEHQRREQERKDREEVPKDECIRPDDEARRHEYMLQMMMMMICKKEGSSSSA